MRTIWLEAFILENLMGNAAILWAAARLFGWPVRGWRIALAAVLGAAYAVVEVSLGGAAAWPVSKFFAASIMVVIGLPGGGIRGFLLRSAVFYAMTFLLGGSVIAMIYLTGFKGAAAMLSFGLLCVLMIEALMRAWKNRSAKRILRLSVAVEQGYRFALSALVDTGASVIEPLSGAPVLLVNKKAMALPPVLLSALENPELDLDTAQRFRIRMVPYRPLGQEGMMAAAFCPDEVCIDGARCKGVYVALVEDELSPTREYAALAPPAILAIAGIGEGSGGKW